MSWDTFEYNKFGVLKQIESSGPYWIITNEKGDKRWINHQKFQRTYDFLEKMKMMIDHKVVYRTSKNHGDYSSDRWFSDLYVDDGLSDNWPENGDPRVVQSLTEAKLTIKNLRNQAEREEDKKNEEMALLKAIADGSYMPDFRSMNMEDVRKLKADAARDEDARLAFGSFFPPVTPPHAGGLSEPRRIGGPPKTEEERNSPAGKALARWLGKYHAKHGLIPDYGKGATWRSVGQLAHFDAGMDYQCFYTEQGEFFSAITLKSYNEMLQAKARKLQGLPIYVLAINDTILDMTVNDGGIHGLPTFTDAWNFESLGDLGSKINKRLLSVTNLEEQVDTLGAEVRRLEEERAELTPAQREELDKNTESVNNKFKQLDGQAWGEQAFVMVGHVNRDGKHKGLRHLDKTFALRCGIEPRKRGTLLRTEVLGQYKPNTNLIKVTLPEFDDMPCVVGVGISNKPGTKGDWVVLSCRPWNERHWDYEVRGEKDYNEDITYFLDRYNEIQAILSTL